MTRIPPIFTREVEEERTELLRSTPLTSTPYPFKAESTYIPPEPSEAQLQPNQERARTEYSAPKGEKRAPERKSGLWSSIALRFSGFTANLKAAVEPLESVGRPELARNFFANRLDEAAALASKNPEAAHRIISGATKGAHPLWRNLLLVGCGDGSALAPALTAIEESGQRNESALAFCVAKVARLRPSEGRYLMKHAVRYLGTDAQLRMLRTVVDNGSPGTTKLVGELFESIMEHSTPEERESKICPAMYKIAHEDIGRKSPGRGFLGALLNGWMSEL